jgi:hypothetical protein
MKMGLIMGFILPVVLYLIIYYWRFSDQYELGEFTTKFFDENQLITFFGAWCLVANIALFTYYINTNRDKTAKGIFAVTLLYGIVVLLLKLFN